MAGPLIDCPPYFSVSAQVRGPELLMTVSGELDIAGAPVVATLYAEPTTAACRCVVVDVSGLTFIDGAGLRALLAGPEARGEDFEISLRSPSRPVMRLLELSGHAGLVETAPRPHGTCMPHGSTDVDDARTEVA